jgi:hypothetical protein
MKKPENIESFETPLSTCWMEDELFCVVTKDVERTAKRVEQHYKILDGKKIGKAYWLVDLQLCKTISVEVLDTIHGELTRLCKGLALVAVKPCEKMVSAYFLRLQAIGLPCKMFTSEKEARKWLKELSGKESG